MCFVGTTPQGNPSNGPQTLLFKRFNLRTVLNVGRYLKDKYFDIVWEYHPAKKILKIAPKLQIFKRLKTAKPLIVFISLNNYEKNILT